MTKKLISLIGSAILALSTLTACGSQTDLNAPIDLNQQSSISSAKNNLTAGTYTTVVQDFVAKAAKMGVKLTDDQIKLISTQRHVLPNGQWAARPAENLTSAQNLDVHFHKHGVPEFHLASADQYLQAAIEFQKYQGSEVSYYFDVTSFSKGYQSNVVKFNSKTHGFGAMKATGEITTYYTNNQPAANRFIPVPADFNF
ncbi:MAG: hypothetical protein H7263_14215 [Candidatus Sericytochromatia bacterium]|nr:hypothetical protein [Candidatus Sericytochromatia bacterium]